MSNLLYFDNFSDLLDEIVADFFGTPLQKIDFYEMSGFVRFRVLGGRVDIDIKTINNFGNVFSSVNRKKMIDYILQRIQSPIPMGSNGVKLYE